MPNHGRGQLRRLAAALQMPSSSVTQTLKGARELSFDQASMACEFLGLSEIESEYFLWLVHHARASTERFRRRAENKLRAIRNEARGRSGTDRVPEELDPKTRLTFYSSW